MKPPPIFVAVVVVAGLVLRVDRLVGGISTVCQKNHKWRLVNWEEINIKKTHDRCKYLLDGSPPTPLSGFQECKQKCPSMSKFVLINFQIRDHDSCSSEDRNQVRRQRRCSLLNSPSLQIAVSYN